jgi:tetratricopeptide (TPR) repeat protein
MAMDSDSGEVTDAIADKLADYRARLSREPANGRLWLEYGDFIDETYDLPDEVVRAYENASQLLPRKDLRLRLGGAYISAGQADVGITLIEDSVAENPRAAGFCILADAYLKLGDLESAKTAAERAIAEDPEFEEGYYLLGEATCKRCREDAIGYFRKAIELDDSYALAWQALGRELAADNDALPEAVSAFRRAIQIDPEDGWALAYLANALWRSGNIEEAAESYQRAIAAFPDCDEMKRWYMQFQSEVANGPRV